jgi:DNA polymerase-3 subunit epsilon
MNFIAIDVETANADLSSICQIGIAKYSNGVMVDEWCSLINPEDYFDFMNVMVHGISENDVQNSPKFPEVIPTLQSYMNDAICVSHTHFDRVSVTRACSKYDINPVNAIWLDSARVARRTWKQFARSGYGLKNICEHIGYEFAHHNALEDAKAAGQIMLAAVQETGLNLDEWLARVKQPIDPNSSKSERIKRDGNPDGALFGEIICFTGALQITRKDAADLAADIGCAVASGVTMKTTILVVGDQDTKRLAGWKKSSKHRKAEMLIEKGQNIRIINESDFKVLVSQAQDVNAT